MPLGVLAPICTVPANVRADLGMVKGGKDPIGALTILGLCWTERTGDTAAGVTPTSSSHAERETFVNDDPLCNQCGALPEYGSESNATAAGQSCIIRRGLRGVRLRLTGRGMTDAGDIRSSKRTKVDPTDDARHSRTFPSGIQHEAPACCTFDNIALGAGIAKTLSSSVPLAML